MNKQNVLLDFEDFLNSYKKRRNINPAVKRILPIYQNEKLAEECAYLIGKILGDGNLDNKYTLRFIGKKEDLSLLRVLITNKFKL